MIRIKRFVSLSVLLCCLLMTACSFQGGDRTDKDTERNITGSQSNGQGAQPDTTGHAGDQQGTPQNTGGSLVYKRLYNGDGNDSGFYHIVFNEASDNGDSNILYYDYAARKEIYLCDQPQCSHQDESCTSWLGAAGMSATLFLHGGYVYLLNSEMGMDMSMGGGEAASAPAIYRMDPDGKNREKLCDLPAGYAYSDNRLTFDESCVYIPLSKNENIQVQENSYMQHETDKAVFRINLESGETSRFLDSKSSSIIAVQGRRLIFSKYNYEQDPEKLLNEKRFDEYDNVMRYAELSYFAYDLEEEGIAWETRTESTIVSAYYGGKLYYLDGRNLHAVSAESGNDEIAASLTDNLEYYLDDVYDGHIMINAWQPDGSSYVTSYAWDVNGQQMKEITLKTSAPIQPVTIYGEYGEYFFVYYDHQQHEEKTWAGTDQYVMDSMSAGLIRKEDFWNSTPAYEPFEVLSQGISIGR